MSSANAPEHVDLLYRDHHGWLLGWLRRKLGCAHDAADLAHDAFLRLLRRPVDLPLREPRAYLTTIAHGLVVNHWRRLEIERAWLDALMQQPESCQPSPEVRALAIEALLEVDALLSTLPDKPRRAFLMAQLDGFTYREIATELGVSERMVKKYMAQAMLHCLRAELAPGT
ncbi:sigma-70 family RNA polymerase sigma factor [Thauera sinica]|uniref:Sigma-70 family RNA polymerase sigma factor n=1 Tax=Thauera sinica TaxID=2665146 RepID=A0ABW1AMP7_9RHOO|nr:sigma-70 family RNA polymerase sigma factor [Thauera sp. K11]ATE60685.1 RNA polymerase subunit sigma [Thauera sp. K11]